MKRYFQFGSVCALLDMPDDCPLPETVALFECPEKDTQVEYTLAFTKDIAKEAESLLAQAQNVLPRESVLVAKIPAGEGRVIFHPGHPVPYAVYRELDAKRVHVFIAEDIKTNLNIETLFVSTLALEKREIFADAMLLHSAYIVHNGQAILFTAPSQTGKSTQARLWEEHMGARTVNGDCSMVRKIDGVWHACGWPICGSSQICFNESYPIRAVVVLFQAKENTVTPLKGFKALRPVMEQIKINMWNSDYQTKALSLIESLVSEVTVLHQGCDISKEAVMCLHDALQA